MKNTPLLKQNIQQVNLSLVPAESVWLANFISERTRNTYQTAVKEFLSYCDIKTLEQLREVNQAHLIAFRDMLISGGASPATVQNRLAALSSLFKHLCEQQVIRFNPTTGVRRPKGNHDQVKAALLTRNQVRALLDAPNTKTLTGLRDRAILHVLFYTGCRRAEVCSLSVRDFYEDGGYKVLNFLVKGGKRNVVAVHQEIKVAIESYLAVSGHGEKALNPLFMPVKNADQIRFLSTRQINHLFKRYLRKAMLPDHITPHSARATFTTEALSQGTPIEAVQKTVGHSHIATTKMYDKRNLTHRESASFRVNY